MVSEQIRLKQGSLSFPRSGNFVTESHYATTEDGFDGGRLFPATSTEGMATHMDRACDLLHVIYGFKDLREDCAEIYNDSWDRVWTPAEGGQQGQGAVGNLRPTPVQELWQGNLMYSSGGKPRPGTKYIVRNPASGRAVVVSMGFEVGPNDTGTFLGGLTTETQWALDNRSPRNTPMEIGLARDQNLPYGPIDCR